MTLHISKNDLILGYQAVWLRDLLRKLGANFTAYAINEYGNLPADIATPLLDTLLASGYATQERPNYDCYKLTDTGRELVRASAHKDFKRSSCDKAFAGLVYRLTQLNIDPTYHYYVEYASVFGSYLDPTKESYGDVDVAVGLRLRDRYGFDGWDKYKLCHVFLKSRSPILQITQYYEEWIKTIPHKDITLPSPIL